MYKGMQMEGEVWSFRVNPAERCDSRMSLVMILVTSLVMTLVMTLLMTFVMT